MECGRKARRRQAVSKFVEMVGTTGFEPATSRTPSVRATRLRYVPTVFGRRSGYHSGLSRVKAASNSSRRSRRTWRYERAVGSAGSTAVHTGHCSSPGGRISPSRLFGQMFPGAGDGETLFIEKALDLEKRFRCLRGGRADGRSGFSPAGGWGIRIPRNEARRSWSPSGG